MCEKFFFFLKGKLGADKKSMEDDMTIIKC